MNVIASWFVFCLLFKSNRVSNWLSCKQNMVLVVIMGMKLRKDSLGPDSTWHDLRHIISHKITSVFVYFCLFVCCCFFALLWFYYYCQLPMIMWLSYPYLSGLLQQHWRNLAIVPVALKQTWNLKSMHKIGWYQNSKYTTQRALGVYSLGHINYTKKLQSVMNYVRKYVYKYCLIRSIAI